MDQQQGLTGSKSKKIELIIRQLDTLPTLPAVAAQLLRITLRNDTHAAEVVRLIESDPALASKIIMLATRTNIGLRHKTASLSKAVIMLGFEAVRNAVLSIKVFQALPGPDSSKEGHFDRAGFWKHSLAVACAAKELVKHIDPKINPEEAFVCGLLHDMGKIALDASLPRSYARVVELTEAALGNIASLEKRVLGIDHIVAGKRLAEKWNLPDTITQTVWLHHQESDDLPDNITGRAVVRTVHLADILAREQRIGYSGNHHLPESAATVAKQLGCPPDVLENIAKRLRKEISARAELLGLDQVEPQQLYHEALGDANAELGKLNERLRYQNEQLHLRSQYFDLLTRLDVAQSPGQTVADVCALLCDLWQQHSRCSRCAVYTIDENELIIEGAVQPGSTAQSSVFLVDRADDPQAIASPSPADVFADVFAVTRVDQSHGWFFEQVAPMFDIAATLMMPLRLANQFVGAVLWQPDQNDDDASYRGQLKELQSFAASAALTISQAHKHEKQTRLSEELAQNQQHLRNLQRELVKKRTLAAVGEMAAGAAHEINNPLAVVVGRADYLASMETDDQRQETLHTIAQQGRVVSSIINELMDFARPPTPQPKNVSVHDLIDQATDQRSDLAQQHHITIQTDLEPDLPEVFIDPDQVASAIAELIANAIDSYHQQPQGDLLITARHNEIESEVVLQLTDHGCGMDDETLAKAFDPFFSKRSAGRGRGLGLSHSTRQIENNGGKLQINSTPRTGTVARLTMPVSQVNSPSEAAVG